MVYQGLAMGGMLDFWLLFSVVLHLLNTFLAVPCFGQGGIWLPQGSSRAWQWGLWWWQCIAECRFPPSPPCAFVWFKVSYLCY